MSAPSAAAVPPLPRRKSQRSGPRPPATDLWLYRDRTTALLRRYFRLSVELGRLPALLGREFFRARVSCYRVQTFEDTVIFVHDMETCLERLEAPHQQLITRMVFQDYSCEETAKLLGCTRRTVGRRFPEALDRMSELLLETGLLRAMEPMSESPQGHTINGVAACCEFSPRTLLPADSYWLEPAPGLAA